MNKGKWAKYKVLLTEPNLHPFLPETKWFTMENVWSLMDKYGDVIAKPTDGQGGKGIIRMTSVAEDQYKIHFGSQSKIVRGKKRAFLEIKKKAKKNYIVQQRIPLAVYKGRPFDIRVMVQRKKGYDWKVTGKLIKVAGAGYIITNTARSRGFVIPFDRIGDQKKEAIVDQVGLQASKILSTGYPGLRTVGIDMGLDTKGNVWIIECNFRPANSLFLRLKDKSMYRRILSYY